MDINKITYTEDELLSPSRIVAKNESQTHFKARRKLLKYAMSAYLQKTLKVPSASYLDHVKLFAENSGLKYINTTPLGIDE